MESERSSSRGGSSQKAQEVRCAAEQESFLQKACSKSLGCGMGVALWRVRYLCAVGWLFAACLGPWAGWLAACNSLNTIKFEVITVTTFLLFLLSLCLTVRPTSRVVAWLWLLVGLIWLGASWLKYYFREWGEDLEKWRDICLAETILWSVMAFLPTILSDPAILWLFSRAF